MFGTVLTLIYGLVLRATRATGYPCYEALEGGGFRECLVIPGIFVETGDGPWQSELSSHSGDSKPCRFCEMGSTVKERSSDSGFLSIMQVRFMRWPTSYHANGIY